MSLSVMDGIPWQKNERHPELHASARRMARRQMLSPPLVQYSPRSTSRHEAGVPRGRENWLWDALLMAAIPLNTAPICLKQVEFSASVHLPFDQLELGDLPLGLTVGPWFGDCGTDGALIAGDAVGERCDRLALASAKRDRLRLYPKTE